MNLWCCINDDRHLRYAHYLGMKVSSFLIDKLKNSTSPVYGLWSMVYGIYTKFLSSDRNYDSMTVIFTSVFGIRYSVFFAECSLKIPY